MKDSNFFTTFGSAATCTEAHVYVRPGVGTWFHPSMYPYLAPRG